MRSIAPSLAALALVGGCAAVPDLGPRPQTKPAAALESAESLAGTPGAWPVEGWWRGFGDPALDALIAEGLAGSPDVAIAAARVRAADALARQAGAALLPQVGADASAGVTQQSRNLGIPPQFVPDGIKDTGRIAATASFDLDLWGKNRAALAAATSDAAAARVDAAQARLLLTTGIAAAYADLAGYHHARDVAAETVRIRAASADLSAARTRAGLDNEGSARAAAARVPAARAEVTALDQAIALTQNRLAALVGAGPDRGRAIARPHLSAPALGIPPQAGIDLIGRRPDIVAARLRGEAAGKRIDVAHADFYPNINLSALVGLQSLGLGKLFSAGSEYGNAAAAISLPIFDGGRITGRYRGARAAYDEAVARYDQTLIGALREVADAIVARDALDRQVAQLRSAVADADGAARLAGLRYRAGLTSQLAQLGAEDTAAGLRRSLAQVEAQRLGQDIALIRALGGGYRAAPQETDKMAEVQADAEGAETAADADNGARRKRLFMLLGIAVAAIALLWAGWYFLTQAGRVHTDNAYVGADSAQVTAQLPGTVTEVRVAGTQSVRKGDVLVVLDDADAKLDLANAEAALRQAQQRFGQQAATAGAAQARIGASAAAVLQARAQLRSAAANADKARVELARRESIAGTGAVAGEELTTARAGLTAATAARDLAAAGVAAAQANEHSASGDAAASAALVRGSTVDTAPDVTAARARVDMARLNLARTVIRAPVDGVVSNRQVQVGQRIAAGAPIMTLVPIATAFVDANYKESQFRKIRIGQPVELTSDFYGGDVVFHGTVTGIAGGTGAAFSLIPAQNATGNWVKVVQRLPVRIALDPRELREHPLRVGLTMDATIDTRGK